MVYKKSDKTEMRKDERRKLIFETATKVFAEKGYHQTSVKNITDRAEISVGTFYLYFKNKEDLFEKLYDEMEQIVHRIKVYAIEKNTTIASERFANVVAASIWTYQIYKELAKIMFIEAVGLNPRFEEKYTNIMIRSCESMEDTLKHLKKIGIANIVDTKISAIAYEGAFNHIITYWLRTDEKIDLKTCTFPLLVFLLQALKMDFNEKDIRRAIDDMFEELDQNADRLMEFR